MRDAIQQHAGQKYRPELVRRYNERIGRQWRLENRIGRLSGTYSPPCLKLKRWRDWPYHNKAACTLYWRTHPELPHPATVEI